MRLLTNLPARLILLFLAVLTTLPAISQQLDKQGTVKTLPLASTSWKPASLYGQTLSSEDSSRFRLILSNRLHSSKAPAVASDDHNEYRGYFQLDGNSLHIRFESGTAVFTPIGGDNLGDSFMKALRETSNYKLHGSQLQLLDQNGAVIATLVKAGT